MQSELNAATNADKTCSISVRWLIHICATFGFMQHKKKNSDKYFKLLLFFFPQKAELYSYLEKTFGAKKVVLGLAQIGLYLHCSSKMV